MSTKRPSLEPRTNAEAAQLISPFFSSGGFPAPRQVCDLRCAWFEARRPTVGEFVSRTVRGSHLRAWIFAVFRTFDLAKSLIPLGPKEVKIRRIHMRSRPVRGTEVSRSRSRSAVRATPGCPTQHRIHDDQRGCTCDRSQSHPWVVDSRRTTPHEDCVLLLHRLQIAVDDADRRGALADRGGDPLARTETHVAGGEDAGDTGLEEIRVAVEPP